MWLFRSSSKGRRIAPRGRIDEETDASTSPARASIAKRNEMGRRVSSSTTAEAPARSSGPRAPPTPEAVSPHDLSRRLQALATLEVPPYEGEDDDEEEGSPNHRSDTPPLAVAQPAPAMQRSTTPPLALALRKGGVVPEKKPRRSAARPRPEEAVIFLQPRLPIRRKLRRDQSRSFGAWRERVQSGRSSRSTRLVQGHVFAAGVGIVRQATVDAAVPGDVQEHQLGEPVAQSRAIASLPHLASECRDSPRDFRRSRTYHQLMNDVSRPQPPNISLPRSSP